ncbi:MAG: hypothetical protein ACRC30_02125 [Clostridium sp.]
MKKLIVLILLGLTCLTMYVVVLWEPSVDASDKEVVKEIKTEGKKEDIEEREKEIKEEEKKQSEKEEKKNEKKEKEEREELKEKESREKEENKKKLLDFRKNLKGEDRKIIDKKMGNLSTVDLMKFEEFLSEGNLEEAINLMKLRMLESDWKYVYEIFGKYKR